MYVILKRRRKSIFKHPRQYLETPTATLSFHSYPMGLRLQPLLLLLLLATASAYTAVHAFKELHSLSTPTPHFHFCNKNCNSCFILTEFSHLSFLFFTWNDLFQSFKPIWVKVLVSPRKGPPLQRCIFPQPF